MKQPVYIIDGARTPFIKARGRPGPFTPVDLAVQCGRPLLLRQPSVAEAIDMVILGCVNVIADEVNPARVAALRLGLGEEMVAFTVQINCGSGMQSIDTAYRYIQDGVADVVLAGGTEALSHSPLVVRREATDWLGRFSTANIWSRAKLLAELRPRFLEPIIGLERGLTDPIVGLNMGQTAEVLAHLFTVSREEADYVHAENAPVFLAREIRLNGLPVDQILSHLRTPVYVTIDLDAFDPAYVPGVGTPEPGGLTWEEGLKLLRAACERRQVVGCDLVELCPIPGQPASDFFAAKLANKIVGYLGLSPGIPEGRRPRRAPKR